MRIVESEINVYEVVLELDMWKDTRTDSIPHFFELLTTTIPSLKHHKCMDGREGGFLKEVRQGDDLAHVIEHIIIELIHMTDPEKDYYGGWTKKRAGNVFAIHYGAPDFLTGRLAALLAVDIVKRLISEEKIDIPIYVEILKNPLEYFAEEDVENPINHEIPVSVINRLDRRGNDFWPRGPSVELTSDQRQCISEVFVQISNEIPSVSKEWEKSFREFAVNFADMIIEKLSLLNLGTFESLISSNDFVKFRKSVIRSSQIVTSYPIPALIIVHSLWLYKNSLYKVIRERINNGLALENAIDDFDDLFQVLLQQVSKGAVSPALDTAEVVEFRELGWMGGTILVADHDNLVRRTCRDMLMFKGFNIHTASDGERAIHYLEEKGLLVTLVMLDAKLPDIECEEMVNEILRRNPRLKILLMSGLKDDQEIKEHLRERQIEYIKKPFTLEQVSEKLGSMISN